MGAVNAAARAGASSTTAPIDDSSATDQAPAITVTKDRRGRSVYRINEAIKVEGRIQKPNAFYVLQRSTLNYDWASLKQDFLGRIVESVEKDPF